MEAILVHRDLVLLESVIKHGPIGLVRLSQKTNIPQHKVRYSLRMLQQDGLVEPSSGGAIATDKLRTILPHIKTELLDCIDMIKKTNKLIDGMLHKK
jgi:predicted transcriptional regulator